MLRAKFAGFVTLAVLVMANAKGTQGQYDPAFGYQWGLHNTGQTAQYGGTEDADIDAPEAWQIWTGSGNVKVAVLDRGLPYDRVDGHFVFDHEDLDPTRIVYERNLYPDEETRPPRDPSGHGTHITGIISAISGNGKGVMGVCWNCLLQSVKIYTKLENEPLYWSILTQAINDVCGRGADVINISSGGFNPTEEIRTAIQNARNQCTIVAVVGNDYYHDRVQYPARFASEGCENVIAVAATMDNDTRASYSNYGPGMVTVAAPGGEKGPVWEPLPPYSGQVEWEENGIPITATQGRQKMVSDGRGGAVIVWDECGIET